MRCRRRRVGAAHAFTGDATPKGCLLASAIASGSAASADVQRAIADIRAQIAAMLSARIERDVAAGRLPAETDAAALAGMIIAVVQGMSVLARDGSSRQALDAIAEHALRAWPTALPAPPDAGVDPSVPARARRRSSDRRRTDPRSCSRTTPPA